MPARNKISFLVLLLLLLPVVILAAVGWGSVHLPLQESAQIIWGVVSGKELSQFGSHGIILWNLRLPRVLLAALTGAALSGAGLAFQALFRNPLADPYVVGVSSGAALGATATIGFGLTLAGSQAIAVVAASFAGALAVSFLVYRIASGRESISSLVLLLAGMAVSAFLSSLISLIMVMQSRNLSETVFWLMGGFVGRGWRELTIAAPLVLVGCLGLWRLHPELNLLLLPEEEARSLGLDAAKVKRWALGLGSLTAASAVSVSGLIGFVGLIVPHLVRLILGPDHKYLLPGSLLAGALLLVPADLVARTLFSPMELPVGALTALLGAPFFIYLLVRAKKEHRIF